MRVLPTLVPAPCGAVVGWRRRWCPRGRDGDGVARCGALTGCGEGARSRVGSALLVGDQAVE
ncbi:MAG: hypothetical protein WAX14_10160, partial [Rhodococcus sp. (in: high G+C Gram-positive bacteria)]|uniref:hypothetical protein n=1 Tax=Rhodococcus sp. TaxID=1831 RepID=UPI003BB6839F